MKINGETWNVSRVVNTLRSLRKDSRKYFKAVIRLLRDAYLLGKARFVWILLTYGVGVGLLGASLGVLFKYVRLLETDATVSYLGYSFHVRDGFTLAFVSVSVMVLLVSSAAVLLYGRLKTRDVVVDFHLIALSRVAEKYGWNPPDEIAWLNDASLRSNVKSLYTGDPMKTGLTLRRLFEGYQHFFIALGGIAALLWIDVAATLYLVLIIGISLVFYFKINKRASGSTRKYENAQGESARRARALLENISSWPNPSLKSEVLRGVTHNGFLKDNTTVLFDRLATRSMTEFFSYVLTAVALGFLVLTLGYSAMEGKRSWATIVGYIITLKMVMDSLKTLFKMFTEVTRLYPGLSRLYEFNYRRPSRREVEKVSELKPALSEDALVFSNGKHITLKTGDIIGIAAPVSLSRYSVTFFEKLLYGGKRKGKKKRGGLRDFISIAAPLNPPLVPVKLREMLGITPGVDAEELKKAVGVRAGKIDEVFPLDPEGIVTSEDLKKLTKDSIRRLSLVSCLLSGRPILLVHSSLLSEDWFKENSDLLKTRIIAVCYNGMPDRQISVKMSVKGYLVAAADGNIVAWGTFSMLKKNLSNVKRVLKDHAQAVISRSDKQFVLAGTDEDEDDDM